MLFNENRVEIIPIEEMEGLRFAVFYFDAPEKMYLSPSMLESIRNGGDLQYVQLSWPEKDRDIHIDAKVLVEEFKKMPHGSEIQFDISEKLKKFDGERTGERRIIFSPKWTPNV